MIWAGKYFSRTMHCARNHKRQTTNGPGSPGRVKSFVSVFDFEIFLIGFDNFPNNDFQPVRIRKINIFSFMHICMHIFLISTKTKTANTANTANIFSDSDLMITDVFQVDRFTPHSKRPPQALVHFFVSGVSIPYVLFNSIIEV